MQYFSDAMDTVDGLTVCLVRNRTRAPFVTQDDPVVLASRWYLEDQESFRTIIWLGKD